LFRQPFDILGQSKYVTTSIGVAVYPLHGTSTEALLKMADLAMYQAKRDGKNAFRFFSDKMSLKGDEQTARKETLRAALEREEFLPHYQPRVQTQSGKITGMEVLIRWQPLGAPLVFPAEFFPLLEESGLVVPVGEWLLEKVCRQNKAWQDAGLPPLRVAVNVSPRQFRQENFPDKVAEILSSCGLDPCYLEIDLTEKAIMDDVDESIKKLKKLKEIGITISIGNFGTGVSSLSCLNRLPIDELKIDRSIINGITSSTNDATVVSASIAMGHSLGKMLVAEGVESEEQYDFLIQHHCEGMQGYFFSRPLPSEDFERLVRREQPLAATFH
jgi:EAL domain-containing protein (putative c-di-GMP-specific phosphodiesterase class I)